MRDLSWMLFRRLLILSVLAGFWLSGVTGAETSSVVLDSESPAVHQLLAPGFKLDKLARIHINRQPAWYLLNTSNAEQQQVLLVDKDFSPASLHRFSESQDIWVSGLIDLGKSRTLPRGRGPSQLSSRNMQIPVLVIRIRSKTAAGALREELLLIHVQSGRQILFKTVRIRNSDGEGGFDIEPLQIHAKGGSIRITGMYQRHLRRRSHCLKPKADPVEYQWDGEQLHAMPRDRFLSAGGCGK